MKKQFLIGLTGLLLGLTSTVTLAAMVCHKCPPKDEVHCETSNKGPLATHWDWGAGNYGSFGGSWKSPDGLPHRKWNCNGSDDPIDFHVVSIFQDGSFEFEIAYNIRCTKTYRA